MVIIFWNKIKYLVYANILLVFDINLIHLNYNKNNSNKGRQLDKEKENENGITSTFYNNIILQAFICNLNK